MFVQKEFSHTVLHGDDILQQQAHALPSNASIHPASRVPMVPVLKPIDENEAPAARPQVQRAGRPPEPSARGNERRESDQPPNDLAKRRAEEQMERLRLLREAHHQDLVKAKEAESRQREVAERNRREGDAMRHRQEEQKKERLSRNNPRDNAIIPSGHRNEESKVRRIPIAPKPAVPQVQRISPKPRSVANPSFHIQGRPISKQQNLPPPPPKVQNLPPPPSKAPNLPPPPPRPQNLPLGGNPRPPSKNDAQERRKRYEELKGRNEVSNNVPSPPPGESTRILSLGRLHTLQKQNKMTIIG
jgi:hypothetical protein